MKKQRIITEDGSHTFFVPALDEHYHSTHGAIHEARHVYIDAALRQCQKQKLDVLEIGFGTGLNTLLTLIEAEKTSTQIRYTTLEKYPLSADEALMLNYGTILSRQTQFENLHRAVWNKEVHISEYFILSKQNTDVTNSENLCFDTQFDVIYFDAFAPDKQSEIWSQAIFDTLYKYCRPGAVLTTYCAKGAVRRMFQSAGFTVERLPGPPGKREMLRARKTS